MLTIGHFQSYLVLVGKLTVSEKQKHAMSWSLLSDLPYLKLFWTSSGPFSCRLSHMCV